MNLLLKWATHKAASFACKNWHYSGILPTGKLVKIAVYEDGKFRGVVIFSRGASPWIQKNYGLEVTGICELTRVALTKHETPVTRIVSIATKMLKKLCPGIRLIVSFADPAQNHKGGIYQAGNWIYTGKSNEVTEYFIGGRWRHTRGAYHHPDRKTAPTRTMPGKHRYLYPLDQDIRSRILAKRQPYPRSAGRLSETKTAPDQGADGGAIPTPAHKEAPHG